MTGALHDLAGADLGGAVPEKRVTGRGPVLGRLGGHGLRASGGA
jgi:hypothetical protein